MNAIKHHIKVICDGINSGFEREEHTRVVALVNFERTLNSMADYVAAVSRMESGLQIARFRMDGDEYRDYIQDLDRGRRSAHDAMLGRISSVNRVCDMAGCVRFYDGDIEDRYAAAEYAGIVVKELFRNRAEKNKPITLSEILASIDEEED